MKISELLKVNASSFKAPQRFPSGNYVVVIVSYDMLPFFWKKSNTRGLAFVPTIRYRDWETDRKSTRLNSSHITRSRMPSSA